jgi:hypothetical protein
MAPDRRGIQFAQVLNTLAADEAMVNAAHQFQKRGERVRRNLFRQEKLTVMPLCPKVVVACVYQWWVPGERHCISAVAFMVAGARYVSNRQILSIPFRSRLIQNNAAQILQNNTGFSP